MGIDPSGSNSQGKGGDSAQGKDGVLSLESKILNRKSKVSNLKGKQSKRSNSLVSISLLLRISHLYKAVLIKRGFWVVSFNFLFL